ncbi:MAG: NAD(P)/FAD-dependent oxidoreductase [Pseudomonadota bacterium]
MPDTNSQLWDALIIGAGAAGLFCGAQLAARGLSVLVADHSAKPAEKVRISGGGRCNFTNLETVASRFLSGNPHFAKSALARYTPWDFCSLMAEHGLSWNEKTEGQLFCDQKSGAVIKLLLDELDKHSGTLRLSTQVGAVTHADDRFTVELDGQRTECRKLVIASGGLSIPKIGATSFAYEIARQFGHEIIPTRPALVPFTFSGDLKEQFAAISGVATPAEISFERMSFTDALLFTHRGLSGPAILQISSYWREGEAIEIDLLDAVGDRDVLVASKAQVPGKTLGSVLSTHYPNRLATAFAAILGFPTEQQIGQISDNTLRDYAMKLAKWQVKPAGTEGWRTAEVTLGGVSTEQLSSRNMESQLVPGLYFIGECVDVTGWLGGYNFQWAWASAAAVD